MNEEYYDQKKLVTKRFLVSVQDIVNYVRKGSELSSRSEISGVEYFNAIIVSPKYQRNYRASIGDESSVIESLLYDIPLPEIFLVTNNVNGIPVRNVMDGQHRLTAITRYVSGDYALKLDEEKGNNENLKGKKFNELDMEYQMKIFNSSISVLQFEEIKDQSLEIELFKTYNSKQRALTSQELTSASFPSKMLDLIEDYVKMTFEGDSIYKIAYNMTDDRVQKQKVNEQILAMLQIIHFGTKEKFQTAPQASGMFMKTYNKYMLENKSENLVKVEESLKELEKLIDVAHGNSISYPFSTEITGDPDFNNYKFNIGIGLVYAYLLHYYYIDFNNDMVIFELSEIITYTKSVERKSNKSTTNWKILEDLVSDAIKKTEITSMTKRIKKI